jgi:hypothetical protein
VSPVASPGEFFQRQPEPEASRAKRRSDRDREPLGSTPRYSRFAREDGSVVTSL